MNQKFSNPTMADIRHLYIEWSKGTATNKMFLQWRGSVSSLLSFSLFTLCRGTERNWSALAFRFAPLLRPPKPATAETQTLAVIFTDKLEFKNSAQQLNHKLSLLHEKERIRQANLRGSG